MIVIGDDENQRVVAARARPIAREPDRIVEHDRVVDRPLHIEKMRVLVDHP